MDYLERIQKIITKMIKQGPSETILQPAFCVYATPALRPFPLILGDLKPMLTLSQPIISSDSPQGLHPILSPCVGDSCSSHCPPELQPLRLHLPFRAIAIWWKVMVTQSVSDSL